MSNPKPRQKLAEVPVFASWRYWAMFWPTFLLYPMLLQWLGITGGWALFNCVLTGFSLSSFNTAWCRLADRRWEVKHGRSQGTDGGSTG